MSAFVDGWMQFWSLFNNAELWRVLGFGAGVVALWAIALGALLILGAFLRTVERKHRAR